MSRISRTAVWWSLGAGAVLVAAYAFLGYRVAPRLLRQHAVSWVRETYGRELTMGAVRVDPFRLQVELRDVSLPDADRQSLLSLRRFLVDFELASLWHRAWVFSSVELDGPAVRLVLRSGGRTNFSDLQSRPATLPAPVAKPFTLPRVWIQSLAVTAGKLEYAETARRQRPLARRVEPITFSLRDFRTTSQGGRFVLAARTAAGEQFDWRGNFALTPGLSSRGEFSVAQLRAASLAEFLPESLPLEVRSGLIRFNGQYDFALNRVPTLSLRLPELLLADLAIRKRGGDADWISAPVIALEQIAFNLNEKSVTAQRLRVEGFKTTAWLNGDGSLNLQQLWQQPQDRETRQIKEQELAQTPAPSSTPAITAAGSGRAAAWKASLATIDVRGAAIDFEDRRIAPFKKLAVNPFNASVGKVSLDLSQALPITLDARINDGALLKLAGSITPAPMAAALELSLQSAPLQLMQAYVLPVADLTIRTGTVSTTGKLSVSPGRSATPAIRYEGDVTFDRLHSVDNALQEDLLNFRRLQLLRLRYSSAPGGLRIERVLVQEPYARVIVSPEQILNISAVLDPQGTALLRAQQQAPAKAAQRESRAERRQRERDELVRKKARAAQAVAALKAVSAPETFPVRIGEVRVQKGRMNFSDLNIRPNFSAEIQELAGTITALSSARDSRASVELAGNLGEFSPVTIGGTMQPFAFDRFTDISLKFENIALPVFNPYSGQFAGYNISKGKLTTDLRYQITDRKLKAEHQIRIDQLEWGEASEFRGEATLPVKFATALLRDRDGVIKLDIPISGTLDDPQLRIGPIVWQIIKNIIVKAVTSPFALLGSLFAGAEEAQFVDFQPGDATLDGATSERLAALAKGLAEKQGISLDVPLVSAPELDRAALLQRRFQQLLEAAAATTVAAKRGDEEAAAPAYASLTAKQRRDALTAWLRAQKRAIPKVPEPPEPPGSTPRAQARELADQAAATFLEQSLRETVTVQDGDLEQLAQARATAVQGALLRSGELPAARVFLVRDGKLQVHEGHVRLQLELK